MLIQHFTLRLTASDNAGWFPYESLLDRVANGTFDYPDANRCRGCMGGFLGSSRRPSGAPVADLWRNAGRISRFAATAHVWLPMEVKVCDLLLADANAYDYRSLKVLDSSIGIDLSLADRDKQDGHWVVEIRIYSGRPEIGPKRSYMGRLFLYGVDGTDLTGKLKSEDDELETNYPREDCTVFLSAQDLPKPALLRWFVPTQFDTTEFPVELKDLQAPEWLASSKDTETKELLGQPRSQLLQALVVASNQLQQERLETVLGMPHDLTEEGIKRRIKEVSSLEPDDRALAIYQFLPARPRFRNNQLNRAARALWVQSLSDREELVAAMGAYCLIQDGFMVDLLPLSRITPLLDRDSVLLKRLGVRCLGYRLSEKSTIPLLRATAASLDEGLRIETITALFNVLSEANREVAAPMSLPVLIPRLQDSAIAVRGQAAKAIGALGIWGAPAVPHLWAALRKAVPENRQAIEDALICICGNLNYSYNGFRDLPSGVHNEGEQLPQIDDATRRQVVGLILNRANDGDRDSKKRYLDYLIAVGLVDDEITNRLIATWKKETDSGVGEGAGRVLLALYRDQPIPERIASTFLNAAREDGVEGEQALRLLANARALPEETIPLLISRIRKKYEASTPEQKTEWGKGPTAYREGQLPWAVVSYGEACIPHIASLLTKEDYISRWLAAKVCADACRNDEKGTFAGAAKKALADRLLEQFLKETDDGIRRCQLEALSYIGHRPDVMVPHLKQLAQKADVASELGRYWTKDTNLEDYFVQQVIAAKDKGEWLAELDGHQVSRANAEKLAAVDLKTESYAEGVTFGLLAPYPDLAEKYLRQRPSLWNDDQVCVFTEMLENKSREFAELRAYVMASDRLPDESIAQVGDRSLLPLVERRIATVKNDSWRLAYLTAVARSLGAPPDRVVKISKHDPGDFYPDSLDMDYRRMAPDGPWGHGHRRHPLMVTGKLQLPNGAPLEEPKFFDVNGRWFIGTLLNEPAPVRYDRGSGAFVFMTTIFASFTQGGKEPGPYETGSALVRIESKNAETMFVRFFDEMPHVEITIDPKSIRQ